MAFPNFRSSCFSFSNFFNVLDFEVEAIDLKVVGKVFMRVVSVVVGKFVDIAVALDVVIGITVVAIFIVVEILAVVEDVIIFSEGFSKLILSFPG